ncbi:Protein LDB17 [Pseudozyma hubeiensis]|nr:Protein LDB17 [Pseudozyma hubeiensis]
MDPFAGYAALDNPQHFWLELDDILDTPFDSSSTSQASTSYTTVDQAEQLLHAKRIYVASVLAKFLHLCAASFNDNLASEYNQDYCINRLFSSTAFRDDVDPSEAAEGDASNVAMHQLAAEEAIRIMQTSTSIPVLLMTYEIVLQYGDAFPSTYKSIQASASTVSFVGVRAFLHRLVHQIWAGSYAAQAEAKIGISDNNDQDLVVGWNGAHWDQDAPLSAPISKPTSGASSASKDIAVQISLRQKAVRMLYEVCRVQKLESAHLKAFDERFIHHLFDLVEETRHHHDEDFNYRLIKLLVAMNEQYMVSTLTSSASSQIDTANAGPSTAAPVNLVLSVLQQRLNASKTFGENLIFMLNRASSSDAEDVCMQLLVLKLLYLLFTTKETACYFYTNDLRVLVDIFIRELHDLPDESESLRHTYLRVLHPLLTNTQLCTYPYKRNQIRRLLKGLVSHGHLNDISATTRRLVERCLRAEWCVELDRLDGTETVAKVEPVGGGEASVRVMEAGVTGEGLPMLAMKIKEGSGSVRATANSLAVTTEDGVAGETDSPIDSAEAKSGSLSVPSTMRTRDKRVASLSHAQSESIASPLLRPTSAASLSRATAKPHIHPSQHSSRRTVSAQSAPCTPPRVDSPSLHIGGGGARANLRVSELSPALDGDGDDTCSTSSSWHAHMLEEPARGSGKHQEKVEGTVGSPLSNDSTMHHVAETSDSTIVGVSHEGSSGEPPKRRKPPQPPAQRKPAMQLSTSSTDSGSSSPAAEDPASATVVVGGGSVGKAGGRRRPPPPPPASANSVGSGRATPALEEVKRQQQEEDELASAQSFYIAERLRRGLRIR